MLVQLRETRETWHLPSCCILLRTRPGFISFYPWANFGRVSICGRLTLGSIDYPRWRSCFNHCWRPSVSCQLKLGVQKMDGNHYKIDVNLVRFSGKFLRHTKNGYVSPYFSYHNRSGTGGARIICKWIITHLVYNG